VTRGPAAQPALVVVLAGLALALTASGCAKDPTGVQALVTVDRYVPLVAVIRATVTASGDRQTSNEFRSPRQASEEDAGPAAFLLPTVLLLGVPESWSGPATVTIEALDWQTQAVLARGTTPVVIVRERRVNATVLLVPTAPPPGDGGDSDGGDDGGDGGDDGGAPDTGGGGEDGGTD
jgi:hypothetical protein